MPSLNQLQHEFIDYLLDNHSTNIIDRVESTSERSAEKRMSFYGNAYILRLKEALTSDFEQLHGYLGDELFDSLMLRYIENYPSYHTSLRYFSLHMIEFMKQNEPFNQLPEVLEIATIEQTFANSFDAADTYCVDIEQLSKIDPSDWATLTLSFHPAARILPLEFNSFQIWKSLANNQTPPAKTADQTSWLIWRENYVSRYRALDNTELSALNVVMSGGNFADVCETLLEYFDENETPLKAIGYLQLWINNQMVSAIKV